MLNLEAAYPFPEFVDNTALSAYKTCPAQWYYTSVRQITTPGGNIHLHAGAAFARGLEITRKAYHHYGYSELESTQKGIEALFLAFGNFQVPEDSRKTPEALAAALVDYFIQYPLAQDPVKPLRLANGKHAIEFNFALPLPIRHPQTGNPILYKGRFDMLGLFDGPSPGLFAVDEKTASQLGQQWMNNWELDSQFTGYCWAAREYNYPVIGAIVRGISLLARGFGHAQAIVYRPQWQIDRWLETTCELVNHMIHDWKAHKVLMALDKHACNSYGGCAYKRLCLSPNPEQWISSDFEPRIWDPSQHEDDGLEYQRGQ